jgi:hypothetical protein
MKFNDRWHASQAVIFFSPHNLVPLAMRSEFKIWLPGVLVCWNDGGEQ